LQDIARVPASFSAITHIHEFLCNLHAKHDNLPVAASGEKRYNVGMKTIKQIGVIFAACWIGQILSRFLPFAFSASIIGMILILFLLLTGILRIEHIRENSSFLLSNMSFFLIPAGVSVINYFDVIGRNILVLVFICVASTIITFCVTAFTVKALLVLMGKFSGVSKDGSK
jgi:holin-like protein